MARLDSDIAAGRIRRVLTQLSATCLALSLFLPAALADTLALRGGDRLTGVLVRAGDGVIVFRTALGGLMVTPADEIEWLQTDGYYTLRLEDGVTRTGRLVREAGRQRLAGIGDDPTVELDPAAIVEATPVELDMRRTERGDQLGQTDGALRARIDLGYLHRETAEDFSAPYGRLTLERTTSRYHFLAESLLTVADDASWPRLFDTLAELRLARGRALGPEAGVILTRDLDRGIAFRGGLHLGAGRAWDLASDTRLLLSAGVQGEYTRYDADLLPRMQERSRPARALQLDMLIDDVLREGPGALGDRGRRLLRFKYYQSEFDDWQANLYFRLRHETRLIGRVAVDQELRISPDLGFDELRARAWSRLRWPVADDFAVELDLRLDYESASPFDCVDRWAPSIGAGVTWEF